MYLFAQHFRNFMESNDPQENEAERAAILERTRELNEVKLQRLNHRNQLTVVSLWEHVQYLHIYQGVAPLT